MIAIGFDQGVASPCVFDHKQRGIRTYVHGDDYVSTGMPHQLDWMKKQLEGKYQVTTQLLGPDKHHQQQLKIFNGIVQWDGTQGVIYEADPRHAELVIDQLQLGHAKSVVTLGTREEGTTQEDVEEKLGDQEATKYWAIVARCNYLAPDRLDIACAVKGLARQMANPTRGGWTRLKRLCRYLCGKPRLQQRYQWQDGKRVLKAYSDSDWAGCKSTRKSTTGGCLMTGTHAIKTWSKTQSLIALSSGEAELYATLKVSAEPLGLSSMLRDMGYVMSGEVCSDASAALGVINRTGLGKTRHIDTSFLWIQQTAAEQRLRFHKVLGKDNPADLFTKHLDQSTSENHIGTLQYRFATGRAEEAPKLHGVWRSVREQMMDSDQEDWEFLQLVTGRNQISRSKGILGVLCRGGSKRMW